MRISLKSQTVRMEQLAEIRAWIYQGKVDEALKALDQLLDAAPSADSSLTSQAPPSATLKAEAYYLRGNAYRKQGNWQQALNNYQQAIDLDSHSAATEARRMVIDILNFYNKEMYNQ